MKTTIFPFVWALAAFSFDVYAAEHETELSGRLRLAGIELDPIDGAAASLLLRAGLDSEWSEYFSTKLELDHVSSALESQHSNGVRNNGKPQIPDVDGTEVNQAFARLNFSNVSFSLGRESLNLDDQRFVGGNSFWQNQQTFDGLNISYKLFSATEVFYAYIANANRIFGDGVDKLLSPDDANYSESDPRRPARLLGDHEHQSHLLNINIQDWDYQELSLFYYDIDNKDAALTSSHTLGFRYRFEKRFGPVKPSIIVSAAQQERTEFEAPSKLDYYLVDTDVSYKSVSLGARYERLGSENAQVFVTPLASLHDFHGWVDKFTDMPAKGIVDQSLKLLWRKAPVKIDARYHWFQSNADSVDWGREFDLDVIYKINKKHRILLRYGDYRSAAESRSSFPSEKRIFFNYQFEL